MTGSRRLDLDWLRIGAFAALILYHIGMVFVPWDFHIKTAQPVEWVQAPMLLLNAWRLPLLFLVSGVATRFLWRRVRSRLAGERLRRLGIPLVAGMALWIAPQAWVDVRVNHGYTESFVHFWLHDNLRFDDLLGIRLPTWNQLWFVAYLLTYSLVFAALAAVVPAAQRGIVQNHFDRVFGGWRLLALPIAVQMVLRVWAYPVYGESHGFAGDWFAHGLYGFSFAFGLGLAGTVRLWGDVARWWRGCAAIALLAWVVVAWRVLAAPSVAALDETELTLLHALRAVQGWTALIALLGFAQAFLQHDHPWRKWLNRAVFPAYIIHQTVILLVMYWLRPLNLEAGAEFAVLVAATTFGSWLFAVAAMQAGWLSPLFGVEQSKVELARPSPSRTEAP